MADRPRDSRWLKRLRERFEEIGEAERDQLPLWLPAALLAGIAAWFWMPERAGECWRPGPGIWWLGRRWSAPAAGPTSWFSDRRLPRGCDPRWLRADAALFARTGGMAITFGQQPRVTTVAGRAGDHPWSRRLSRN